MEQEVFIDEVCDNFFKKMNSLYIEYIIGSKNALLFYHNYFFTLILNFNNYLQLWNTVEYYILCIIVYFIYIFLS